MLFKSGLKPVQVTKADEKTSQLQHALNMLKSKGVLKKDERVVVVQVVNEERHD
jgi:hypothetical protein